MPIKIIDRHDDIYLTEAQYDRFTEEWLNFMTYTSAPVSFEEYVRKNTRAPIGDKNDG